MRKQCRVSWEKFFAIKLTKRKKSEKRKNYRRFSPISNVIWKVRVRWSAIFSQLRSNFGFFSHSAKFVNAHFFRKRILYTQVDISFCLAVSEVIIYLRSYTRQLKKGKFLDLPINVSKVLVKFLLEKWTLTVNSVTIKKTQVLSRKIIRWLTGFGRAVWNFEQCFLKIHTRNIKMLPYKLF